MSTSTADRMCGSTAQHRRPLNGAPVLRMSTLRRNNGPTPRILVTVGRGPIQELDRRRYHTRMAIWRRNPAGTEQWETRYGDRTEHRNTPEFEAAYKKYPEFIFDLLDKYSGHADLSLEEKTARARLAQAVAHEFFTLIRTAKQGPLRGDGLKVPTEWLAPVRNQRDMGEVRWPASGCDDLNLHHRAYFAAPRDWPTVMIWLLAAPKPDVGICADWKRLQDETIEEAVTIRTLYYHQHRCRG